MNQLATARRSVRYPAHPSIASEIRIGFLSAHNYLDRTQWSGTLFYMQQALVQKGFEVVFLGAPKQYPTWQRKLIYYGQNIKERFIAPPFHPPIKPQWVTKVQNQIAVAQCDFILAPIASKEIAALKTDVPIIYLSDTTAKLYCQEHHYTHALGHQTQYDLATLEQIELLDAIALTKAHHIIYSSQWAAQSAVQDYGMAADKVSILPFGANLDQPPSASDLLRSRQQMPPSPCQLLFIGSDWQRKGGDIAFQTLLELLHRGIDAELVVVGTVPPVRHPKLTVIPQLDKNIPSQRQQLNQLFQRSHFFILPSRAECFGISLCEASAFGLPALTTAVGGITTVIKNGRNGYKLPLTASGIDYANVLSKILADPQLYQQLTVSARAEYDNRLNWQCWSDRVLDLLLSLSVS